MHPGPRFVCPVKTSPSPRITCGYMVAVVGEALPGGQARDLADDFVAFDHQPDPVDLLYDPLSSEQGHRPLRGVADRDEVHEGMGLIHRQARSAVVVA